MTGSFVNTSSRRVDLADGRVLAPGEIAHNVAPGSEHNQALEDAGDITRAHEPKSDTAKREKS
jgi:hypothetical protein